MGRAVRRPVVLTMVRARMCMVAWLYMDGAEDVRRVGWGSTRGSCLEGGRGCSLHSWLGPGALYGGLQVTVCGDSGSSWQRMSVCPTSALYLGGSETCGAAVPGTLCLTCAWHMLTPLVASLVPCFLRVLRLHVPPTPAPGEGVVWEAGLTRPPAPQGSTQNWKGNVETA